MILDDFKMEIYELAKKHNVTIVKQRFKSAAGRCWISERKIKIPKINSLYNAGVAVHEIAHVILNINDSVPEYLEEYEVEKWTISFLKKHNMHIDYKADFEDYVNHAKLYVSTRIEKYKKDHAEKKIRKRVLKWIGAETDKYINHENNTHTNISGFLK
jgi:hypothetical protein